MKYMDKSKLSTSLQEHTNDRTILHYRLGSPIGSGTFGKVYIGCHLLTNQKVAIKILHKKLLQENEDKERVEREIKILKSTAHANIIKLLEIIETPSTIYIVMEYASKGELFDFIVKQKHLPEPIAANFFNQIINAIEYLHTKGIAHRDLKPENLLISEENSIKLIDFGLSNFYVGSLKTACGSPSYAAPEMIAGKRYKPLQTDIWSAGIILFAMICGYLPFDDNNISILYRKILKGVVVFNNDFIISEEAKSLILGILRIDPSKRYGLKEIKKSEFIQKYCKNANSAPSNQEFDENIIDYFSKFVNKSELVNSLKQNRHNLYTSTYYTMVNQLKEKHPLYINIEAKINDTAYSRVKDSSFISPYRFVPKKLTINLANVADPPLSASCLSHREARTKKTVKGYSTNRTIILRSELNFSSNPPLNKSEDNYLQSSLDTKTTDSVTTRNKMPKLHIKQISASIKYQPIALRSNRDKVKPRVHTRMPCSTVDKLNVKAINQTFNKSYGNTTFSNGILSSRDMKLTIAKYDGPFIISLVTNKKPNGLMKVLNRMAVQNGYLIINLSEFHLQCIKLSTRVDVELTELEDYSGVFYFKVLGLSIASVDALIGVQDMIACLIAKS